MLDMSKPALPPLQPPDARRSPPQLSADANLDRMLHAWQSRYTGGRSPSTLALAFLDWAAHAANAPFQTAALGEKALAQWRRLAQAAMRGEKAIASKPGDHRFAHPAWSKPPYDFLVQSVLLAEEWCDYRRAQSGRSWRSQSANCRLHRAAMARSDSRRPTCPGSIPKSSRSLGPPTAQISWLAYKTSCAIRRSPKAAWSQNDFASGVDLAATPGKVVFRNALMELIQYCADNGHGRRRAGADRAGLDHEILYPRPFAGQFADPLAGGAGPHRVRDLLAQSQALTCAIRRSMITARRASWRRSMRSRRSAAHAKIHATGYCLGGTLLTIAAAAMARDKDDRLASLSLFAAQTDFTEAGDAAIVHHRGSARVSSTI